MPVGRSDTTKSVPINIVGSSTYGIYDKQSTERTINLTISDDSLVDYPGYKIAIKNTEFNTASEARGLYASIKLNKLFAVFDDSVFVIDLSYDHLSQEVTGHAITEIGNLDTETGPVYFTENNKPQILISDGAHLYLYDQSLTAGSYSFSATDATHLTFTQAITFGIGEPITFAGGSLPTGITAGVVYYVATTTTTATSAVIEIASSIDNVANGVLISTFAGGSGTATTYGPFQDIGTNFTPGYITFHDTYFIAAASNDTFYAPAANNTWRLSGQNNGFIWQSIAQTVGLLETKPDNTQAVVRFPSKGNMILVMGKSVTEMWFDTGAQLFPYQRQDQGSIDYGCVSPATVAFMDEIVIWLAANEKSGPIIMYSTGGLPQKVTTDGIDFQLSQINNPESSQGFLFRKNGHLFYHINFYADNISFVVDMTLNKIYQACDENLNYYIMGQVVWFKNQYFSVSRNRGNLYIFDTVFSSFKTTDGDNVDVEYEIPRIRITDNIRLPTQDWFILNDVGFTIETGATDYQYQDQGPIRLLTEDGNFIVIEDTAFIMLLTEDGNFLETESGSLLSSEQDSTAESNYLIEEQNDIVRVTPRVDMCISYDGGVSFSSWVPYVLNPIGKRRNRLMWWNCGLVNDCVLQFRFIGLGRVVAMDGQANIRQ